MKINYFFYLLNFVNLISDSFSAFLFDLITLVYGICFFEFSELKIDLKKKKLIGGFGWQALRPTGDTRKTTTVSPCCIWQSHQWIHVSWRSACNQCCRRRFQAHLSRKHYQRIVPDCQPCYYHFRDHT
jgi:hypothetical protein